MPNIGFPELIVIVIIALMVFGPKKLPEMGRTIGKSLREFRRASAEIRSGLVLDDEPPRVPSPGSMPRKPDTAPEPVPPEATESPPGDAPKT
jgi:sec-independent protein translocase protein TatA